MGLLTTQNYFLILSALATILLWGLSLWNGTVTGLIKASWYGVFEDGTPFLTKYTGLFILDFPISLLVAFFFFGTNGRDEGYQLFLLDAYSTLQVAFIWLYVESGRIGEKPYSIAKYVKPTREKCHANSSKPDNLGRNLADVWSCNLVTAIFLISLEMARRQTNKSVSRSSPGGEINTYQFRSWSSPPSSHWNATNLD